MHLKSKSKVNFLLTSLLTLMSITQGCGPSGASQNSGNDLRVEEGSLSAQSHESIKIYSLGDSITTAMSSQSIGQNNLEESWAIGDARPELNSHFQNIRSLITSKNTLVLRENLAIVNSMVLAEQGATFSGQATNLAGRINPGDFSYVTVLIGANDVCQTSLDPAEFKTEFKTKFLNSLQVFKDKVDLILLSSLPDISIVRDNPHCLLTGSNFAFAMQNLCPNVLGPEDTFDEYIAAVNSTFEEAALTDPNKIVFDNNRVYKADIDTSMISSDCFHPNQEGQSLIASESWWAVAEILESKLGIQQ